MNLYDRTRIACSRLSICTQHTELGNTVIFSASVIFFCSLRGNPVVHATVLMFVAGIIKYAERTY